MIEERIRLAKTKTKKLLGHFLYLAAIHENNAIVVFSPMLAEQIPHSYAAHAFNVFQHVMHDFEIVRLCALWDRAGEDKESIPSIVNLIDHPPIIDALVDEVRSHWRSIAIRNIASLDPTLSKVELQRQKALQDALPDRQAAMAACELRSAIEDAQRILSEPGLTALRDYRNRQLAHSLASNNKLAKADPPLMPLTYDTATKLFDDSVPIVERLHCWVTGNTFSINESRVISSRCAEALWKGCKFTVVE